MLHKEDSGALTDQLHLTNREAASSL